MGSGIHIQPWTTQVRRFHCLRPYVVAGGGGLTTAKIRRICSEHSIVFRANVTPSNLQNNNNLQIDFPGINTTNGIALRTPSGPVFFANDVLGNDTFFTFSYGGGLKAARLWGPMGVFGDFRGRTVPNFFGHANTWPELSAGLNFSWGEK